MKTMITRLVEFDFPPGTTVAEAAEIFNQVAPEFRVMPGLIRKYCLFGGDSNVIGVCLWEDRESAERSFNDEWRKKMSQRYGSVPQVTYYATPVVVDNALGVIEGDAISTTFGLISGAAAE